MHRTPFKNLVPPGPPLRLVEQRAALLVVDFQVFAAERSAGPGRLAAERGIEDELDEYYEQVAFARRNVRDLLGAFRGARLPVLFTRRLEPAGSGAPWVPAADDATAAILPDLAPVAGEAIVTRAAASPFAGGRLDAALAAAGARALVVAGAVLGDAVDRAVRDSAERGLAVVLVSDGCAAETWALHECLTGQLAGGLVRVRPTEAVLAMLGGGA